jgi:transcriptional regulator with XRE-family HTH domain
VRVTSWWGVVGATDGAGERHDRDAAARALGERLRWVRAQQGRSLQEVEDASAGELKASVLGAYERGERAVSIPRLRTLAAFYGVPVAELLPVPGGADASRGPVDAHLVIDLVALERVRDQEPALARYVQAIQTRRGDWGGRVLTVRGADLDTLAAVAAATPAELRERLAEAGIVR